MKLLKKLIISVLVLTTPVFVNATETSVANTLGNNTEVSNNLVKDVLGDGLGKSILEVPYRNFYRIDGRVRNNKINFEKLNDKHSYPDAGMESLALGLMGLIQIPVYSTGSRIKTRATAYVAMYDGAPSEFGMDTDDAITIPTSVEGDPNTTVLVIIKQKETSNAKNPNMRLANAELGKRDGSQAYFFKLAI